MIKEAIEKIIETAKPEMIESAGRKFLAWGDGALKEIPSTHVHPDCTQLGSLSAVIAMVKNEAKKRAGKIFIAFDSCTSVNVFEELNEERERVFLYSATAKDVPGWEQDVTMAFDQAAIALQTRFQDTKDREYTIGLLSQIQTGAHVTYNDNGVATTVVTQKGVSLQQNQTIRPVVSLKPYRTWQEIEQPNGLFLIRISERGIKFVEADGGMWKLEARKTACKYVEAGLAGEIKEGKVVTML